MSGVRPRVRGRADLHLRVVLRPARGGLRLRRDPRRDLAGEDRRRAAVDLALRRPAAGRSATPPSTSAPASPRWCGPTGSPPSSVSARCGSRTTRVNPTNSFKDRVTSVALSKALEFGFKIAACASTGNLANSVAAHAAHAGLAQLRVHPRRPRAGQGRHHRRSTAATSSRSTATTTTSTASAPSSRARTRGRSST